MRLLWCSRWNGKADRRSRSLHKGRTTQDPAFALRVPSRIPSRYFINITFATDTNPTVCR